MLVWSSLSSVLVCYTGIKLLLYGTVILCRRILHTFQIDKHLPHKACYQTYIIRRESTNIPMYACVRWVISIRHISHGNNKYFVGMAPTYPCMSLPACPTHISHNYYVRMAPTYPCMHKMMWVVISANRFLWSP